MSFLAPAALALGLLAIPIILLYMLRLRRREQSISSTLLWRDLILDRSANVPWQRLRRNLLLILQLMILGALVLALARPYLRVPGRINGNLIVLVDVSASMMATDGNGGTTRFDEAVIELERLIDDLGAGDRMTLISVGLTPAVLAATTNDRQQLHQALDSLRIDHGPADWTAAFALAAGSSQGFNEPKIAIISDGGLPATSPALPGEVNFIPVGRRGENLAITALGTRVAGSKALDLLVSVANDGSTPAQGLLNLYLDDGFYDSRRIEIAPNEKSNFSWTLPADAGVIEARLEPSETTFDFLEIDNRAWRVNEGQANRRVLLVTQGNLFLERFFSILPGYDVIQATTDEWSNESEGSESFDLYVFDGLSIPNPLPRGNVLIVNPQPTSSDGDVVPPIGVTGVFTNTTVTRKAESLFLTDVDWSGVHIAEASTIHATGLEPVIVAEGGPLLLAGEIDGRRVAVLPFDLRRSDLPLQIAFPVVMANIMSWLEPQRVVADNENLHPGSVVALFPESRADTITVVLPDGDVWKRSLDASEAQVLFEDTQQTGIYSVYFQGDSGEEHQAGQFAVNFFYPDESHIQPENSIRIGQIDVVPGRAVNQERQELWPWLLLGGLIIILVEWWVTYHRGNLRSFLRFR